MNKDEAERAHAAIRRLTKECIDLRSDSDEVNDRTSVSE